MTITAVTTAETKIAANRVPKVTTIEIASENAKRNTASAVVTTMTRATAITAAMRIAGGDGKNPSAKRAAKRKRARTMAMKAMEATIDSPNSLTMTTSN